MNRILLFLFFLNCSFLLAVKEKHHSYKIDTKTGKFLDLQKRRNPLLRVDIYSPSIKEQGITNSLYPSNVKTPFGQNIDKMKTGIDQIQTTLNKMQQAKLRFRDNVYVGSVLFTKKELLDDWSRIFKIYQEGLNRGYDAGGYPFMVFYKDQIETVSAWVKEMREIRRHIDRNIPKDAVGDST